MTGTSLLTPRELQILREVNGDIPPSPWGARVGACLESLRGSGFISKTLGGQITDKGKQYLKEHPQ